MYVNPTETGLVILGASKFEQNNELGRAVFATAADRARAYFKSESGLGIPDENVRSLFNNEASAQKIQREAHDFVRQSGRPNGLPSFRDVFVYIVTHGVKYDNSAFHFMMRSSHDHTKDSIDPHYYIEFASLFRGITSACKCRVYFIIDACQSAYAVQSLHGEKDFSQEPAYSNVQSDMMPDSGAVVFLSNQREEPGEVFAKDKAGLDMPLFSEVLFDCLENGASGLYPYGFSFQTLKHLCRERMKTVVEEKKIEALQTSFDVFDFRQTKGHGLSNAIIFQNNDPDYNGRNAYAHEIRTAWKKAFSEQANLRLAVEDSDRLQALNSGLEEKLKQVSEKLAQAREDASLNRDTLRKVEGRARALSWIVFTLAIISPLTVPLAVYGILKISLADPAVSIFLESWLRFLK